MTPTPTRPSDPALALVRDIGLAAIKAADQRGQMLRTIIESALPLLPEANAPGYVQVPRTYIEDAERMLDEIAS